MRRFSLIVSMLSITLLLSACNGSINSTSFENIDGAESDGTSSSVTGDASSSSISASVTQSDGTSSSVTSDASSSSISASATESDSTSSSSSDDSSSSTSTSDSSSSDTSSSAASDSSGSVPITATASTTAQSLTVGTAMSTFSPLTPSGGVTPYTFSITSGTLPTGLNLDPSTGEVTGTPTATYTAADVVFSVKDADNIEANTTSTVSFSVDLAASVAPSTGWTTVKMGGGGYVPGIIYHPTVANLRYARTDMDGVYRWDENILQWTPLTDGFAPEDGGYEGAESMAVDPTDASKVYMTANMTVSNGNGRFYYSANQGSTWNYVTLPFPIGSNNQGRAIGERLMVDPNLPSTLFYASRTQGLWKSTDSGLNWSQVTSLSSYKMSDTNITNSNGGSPVGVEFVMFDTTVPTTGFTPTGSATQTIYVGVAPDYKALAGLSSYLYKSTDGGATWTGITIPTEVMSATTGEPATPVLPYIPHMARSADGMFYVPFASSSGPGSSAPSWLYKFDGSTTWTKLIASGEGLYFGGVGGLSVYGSGATTKVAFGVSGTWGDHGWVQIVMASDDAGANWHEIGRSGDIDGSLNYHDVTGYWGWADTLQIDPFNPDHMSYVLGGGIMSTTDAFSASEWKPHWKFDVDGIEEMVNLDMTVPPPTASYVLLSAHGDTGLYVNMSLTSSANIRPSGLGGGNGTGIDMAWDNPAYIAAVGTFITDNVSSSQGTYSTDSGVTWTKFSSVPPTASNTGDHSRVVVTADGSNIIWSVAGQIPYYSTDNGNTWTATNLPTPVAAYGASYHIAADRKNPLKVYAYDHGGEWYSPTNSGKFYYSIDGGHTFTVSTQTWSSNGFNVTDLAVNPFAEGDLWLADANNLWHSVDSGVTWTKLTAMATIGAEYTIQHGAMKVALGVPAVGSSYSAAVYFVGRISGVYGVYRSDDEGANWTRIDDDNHRYGGVGGIAADTSVYGRVFLAGRGMDYNY